METIRRWEALLIDPPARLKSYTPGTSLLIMDKGSVRWGQGENNSGGCNFSYNAYCPIGNCDCSHKLTGCGPVAMGQIMWYWEWPKNYNWDIIPERLTNYSSAVEEDEIARLLDDCGDAANKGYIGCSTWTTVNNIESALKNNFLYKAVDKHVRDDWPGESWLDLMRAEIDAERPVIYRGDKSDFREINIFLF